VWALQRKGGERNTRTLATEGGARCELARTHTTSRLPPPTHIPRGWAAERSDALVPFVGFVLPRASQRADLEKAGDVARYIVRALRPFGVPKRSAAVRLNACLPSFLLHSISSPLAVSARARLRPKRFGAYPPQSRSPRSARRRRAAARRSPRPSVRTRDTGLLSGSCHQAVLPGLSKMQTGR
jgi:hypothetical protein